VDDISDENLLEAYIGGLKQDIKHELFLRHPTNIMEAMQIASHIQAKNKATHKSTIGAYTIRKDCFGVYKTSVPQLTRLTPQNMEEEERKDYVSIVTTSTITSINVVIRNYST
jgi:hypothetical protein